MSESNSYNLYKRKLNSGKTIYYVRYALGGGKYTPGRSTHQTSRKAAQAFADEKCKKGLVSQKKKSRLQDFATDFFDWNGEYALEKRAASKKSDKTRISEDQCKSNQARTDNHIIKTIGHVYLDEIDDDFIIEFRKGLIEKGSAASTINKIMYCFRLILVYCVKKGYKNKLPSFPLKLEPAEKEPEILTQEELTALFNLEWPDLRVYTANLISSATGFRLSEVMGIKRKNILPGKITITGSWSSRERKYRHQLKNGSRSRTVPIPEYVQTVINELLDESPYKDPESYLLYCPGFPKKPIEHIEITKGLYEMLGKLDPPIKEADRKRRQLSFHSFRYGFNSALIMSGLPLEKIKKLTGHLSDSMVQRYLVLDDMEDVKAVTTGMLDNIILFKNPEAKEQKAQ